jgi:hypothetical protein
VALLQALELNGKILLVLEAPDEGIELSFRNLPFVKVVYPGNLSTFDLLAADRVLFTTGALDVLTGAKPRAEVTEPAQDTPEADTEPRPEAPEAPDAEPEPEAPDTETEPEAPDAEPEPQPQEPAE